MDTNITNTMRAKVHHDLLGRALRIADLTSTRLGPMRELVLLSVSDEEPGWMRITTAGIEMTTHVWCRTQNGEPGEATVSLGILKDWVALMDDPITLCCERQDLRAESGRNRAWFRMMVASLEFPSPRRVDSEFQVNGLEAIRKAAIAIAQTQDRPILTGLLFRSDGNDLAIVGTDGYRLSECRIAGVSAPVEVVVPHGERVKSMMDIVDSSSATVSIQDKYVVFRAESDDIRAQMEIAALDGRFPAYASLLPRSFPTRVTVATRELLRACQTANVVAAEDCDGTIVLNVSRHEGNEGELRVSSPDLNGTSYVKAVVEGEGEGHIAINGSWLIQGLRLVKEPEISLGLMNPHSPLLVSSDGWCYFIMPRISE